MLKLHRLGIVLQPDESQPRTVAKFNAGMTLAGDVVHMVYRYTEWRAEFDPATQSNYAVDETRYAWPTPHCSSTRTGNRLRAIRRRGQRGLPGRRLRP